MAGLLFTPVLFLLVWRQESSRDIALNGAGFIWRSPDWCDHAWEWEEFSLAYCTSGFLGGSAPNSFQTWGTVGSFCFCIFLKSILLMKDEEHLEKNNFIVGPLSHVKNSQVVLISSPLHPRPQHPFISCPIFQSHRQPLFPEPLCLETWVPRPPSASCCYKASLSCWKQGHFPAVCNPLGATHLFYELVRCLQILGAH